jgi:hypothetical protein
VDRHAPARAVGRAPADVRGVIGPRDHAVSLDGQAAQEPAVLLQANVAGAVGQDEKYDSPVRAPAPRADHHGPHRRVAGRVARLARSPAANPAAATARRERLDGAHRVLTGNEPQAHSGQGGDQPRELRVGIPRQMPSTRRMTSKRVARPTRGAQHRVMLQESRRDTGGRRDRRRRDGRRTRRRRAGAGRRGAGGRAAPGRQRGDDGARAHDCRSPDWQRRGVSAGGRHGALPRSWMSATGTRA